MSKINSQILTEFHFKTSRSGGKGGQHVNTTESRVELSFNILHSAFLSDEQKIIIIQKLKTKIDSEGYIRLYESSDRSQHINKEKLIKKTFKLLNASLIKPKKRVPTKISKGVKQKRAESKKYHSDIKKLRSKKIDF